MAKIRHNNFIDTVDGVFSGAKKEGVLHLYAQGGSLNGRTITIGGKEMFHFGTTGYLGLEQDDRIKEAAIQEKEWAEYLFQDGSMIGLNKDILCQYVEYITNLRMSAVGLQSAFAGAKQNPIPWINTWLSSDNVQVAPQEVEVSSYLVGQIDSEVHADDLGDFEL